MVLVLSGAFVGIMVGLERLGSLPLSSWTGQPWDPFHLVGVALSLVVWLAFRRGAWSLRSLHLADAAFTVSVCACWTGMGFGAAEHVHVEFFVLVPSAFTFIYRSAMFPSSAARTLVISLVSSAVVVAGCLAFHLRPAQPHALGERLAYAGMTLGWCAVAIVVATVCSHVIFGLHRRARVAQQLGQYRLEEKIGQGSMGVVYRASHAMLRRPTAIKLMAGNGIEEVDLLRFEREVQLTAMLSHPNTIDVYDFGRTPRS